MVAMSSPGSGNRPSITRRGAGAVGIAMVVVSLAGYVILLVTARGLSLEDNTAFLTFWSLQFFCFGVLTGLQNEMTRAVRQSAEEEGESHPTGHSRTLPVALLLGTTEAGLVLMLLPWGDSVLGAGHGSGLLWAALGVILYSGHCGINGAMAGAGRWASYGVLLSTEALARLALVTGLLAAVGPGGPGLLVAEVATAAAAGSWLALTLLNRDVRAAWASRSDRSATRLVSSSARAMTGGVGNAVLLVGFPVLLSMTTPATEYAGAAPFLLAISLTRAPIMMPLSAFQGIVITHFIDTPEHRARTLARFCAVILGVAALGALLAALIGPWLMKVLFGPDYGVNALALAALTVSAGLIAIQTIIAALLLALSRQGAYAIGWLVSAAVCILILLGPWALELRAVLALLVGTGSGILVHLALLMHAPMPPSPTSGHAADAPASAASRH